MNKFPLDVKLDYLKEIDYLVVSKYLINHYEILLVYRVYIGILSIRVMKFKYKPIVRNSFSSS